MLVSGKVTAKSKFGIKINEGTPWYNGSVAFIEVGEDVDVDCKEADKGNFKIVSIKKSEIQSPTAVKSEFAAPDKSEQIARSTGCYIAAEMAKNKLEIRKGDFFDVAEEVAQFILKGPTKKEEKVEEINLIPKNIGVG